VNGRVWERNGNRDPMAAPHGAYRCQGEDRWCALAVSTDDQWGALCWMMGNPRWTKDAKFATLLCRKRNEDELDSLMEEWTISLPAEELAAGLQEAGVPAAVVATAEDVHRNPQLKYRKHFSELDHQEIGRSTYDGLGSELSRTPSEMHKAAHVLGEDNYYVYTQVLQFSDEEFVHLLEEGVLD
jgi:benzylsuccinate CoA-transferase BbsF subunit